MTEAEFINAHNLAVAADAAGTMQLMLGIVALVMGALAAVAIRYREPFLLVVLVPMMLGWLVFWSSATPEGALDAAKDMQVLVRGCGDVAGRWTCPDERGRKVADEARIAIEKAREEGIVR